MQSEDATDEDCESTEQETTMINDKEYAEKRTHIPGSNSALVDITDKEMLSSVEKISDKDQCCDAEITMESVLNHWENLPLPKVKRKRKKGNRKRKAEQPSQKIPEELATDSEMRKYWAQRYRLFSRFDEGIKMDKGKKISEECTFISKNNIHTSLFFAVL